jgi:AraC-like DNA-binding protein
MQNESILICAGDLDVPLKVRNLARLDPMVGEVLSIEFANIPVGGETSAEPLIGRGFEEIHRIDPGLCVYFSDAFITNDWMVTVQSRDNGLRLRLAFAGHVDYQGSGNEIRGAPDSCSFVIQPGDARIVASYQGGTEHRFCTLSMTERYLRETLGLSDSELPRMLASQWRARRSALGSFPISRESRASAVRYFNIRSKGIWRDIEIRAITLDLMRHLLDDLQRPAAGTITSVRLRPDERSKLFEIRELIHTAPTEPRTIEQLCKTTGLNRNKLHFGFKRLFGMSVHEYYINRRLQIALELLRTTALPIGDIAFRVGYSEPTNFAAAFRKRFNMTPNQARKSAALSPTEESLSG